MKIKQTSVLCLASFVISLSAHAAFTRLATETYPGGGGVATNAVAGITTNGVPVALDAQKIAHLIIPEGGGPTGGVTKAYVDAHDLATLFASTNYTDDATNALDLAHLAALAATNTAIRAAIADTALAATNYTDTATNTLAASYASQLSYASQSSTNYTYTSTLAATNFVKAGYLPLAGGYINGDLHINGSDKILYLSNIEAEGMGDSIWVSSADSSLGVSRFMPDGTQFLTKKLAETDYPAITNAYAYTDAATNALDTALRAAIDNEEDERKTADSKLLTKESTSYPATRNIKWSGYNLVLMGPMLFETWSKIKAGTASSNEELPDYITSRLAAYQTNLVVSAATADKVLKNDGTNIFWTVGGGSVITEETVTNIASSASITNLGSVAYTDSSTNALAAYCDATFQPRSRYQWVRPDDWGVDYTVSDTISTTTVISDKEDANLRVIRSEKVTKTPTRNGQAFAVKLDPVSTKPLPMPTWSAVTPGIVINSDGTFTAAVDGLFRISATSGDVIRYADIAAQLKPAITTTNSYYYADKASTTRKTVNDAALTTLNAATLEGEHTIEGVTFVVYNTFTPHMANKAAGNVAPFAVSPHILACAHHYENKITGPITFTDGTSSASVTRLKWINLYDWAMTNGFTEAELSGVRLIRDIDMIICDKATAVPNACVPYFMSKATATTWFGADLTGVSCWFLARDFEQALPMVMLNYGSWASSPAYYTYHADEVRQDILTRLTVMGKQNPGRSGDSGRPVFIMKDGNPIVVAHAYSLGCGPDYVGAFPVIKAFVEWYGDTIKEAN